MELVDMPGMSPILRICRLGTSNPRRVRGVFKGPFCVPTDEGTQIPFGDFFCMGGDPLKKKLSRCEKELMRTRRLVCNRNLIFSSSMYVLCLPASKNGAGQRNLGKIMRDFGRKITFLDKLCTISVNKSKQTKNLFFSPRTTFTKNLQHVRKCPA